MPIYVRGGEAIIHFTAERENTMKARYSAWILLLVTVASACETPAAPPAEGAEPAMSPLVMGQASLHVPASGIFTQSAITGLDVQPAGPNTIVEQTSEGTISGTLTGPYQDDVKVVIHPNGRFNAHFTITCQCTVDGRQGVLELVANDTGELVSPDVAVFAGRAVITGGTGELAGLRGVLEIEGVVDVPTGLSTYTYSGHIHFQPS
jgi:hypothetical protein